MQDASAASYTQAELGNIRGQKNCRPTAKPMLWPRVKYNMEGLEPVRDGEFCRYCCVSQVDPLTPSNVTVVISKAV